MNVQGIGHGNTANIPSLGAQGRGRSASAPSGSKAGKADSAPSSQSQANTSHVSQGDHQLPPGLFRLMQQGHFNGVADLRHRIKYNDELSGLQPAC